MKTTILLLIAVILASGFVGFGFAQFNPTIVYQKQVVYQDVPYPEYHYITQEIPIITEVEVIKEVRVEIPVPNNPREFEDFRALSQFIRTLDIEGHSQPNWDCDDYAYYVWVEAIKMGYLMSFETTEINGKLHACNSTVIGNVCYFIEPEGGKIWSEAWLD